MFCRHEYGSRSGWELVANAGEQYPHSVVIFIIALVVNIFSYCRV